MKIREIQALLAADLLTGDEFLDTEVSSACTSDMMSDVLAYVKDQGILLTGLINTQVIRTASMMDMVCVVFIRNKKPTPEIVALAKECGITLLASPLRAYEASGLLYHAGLGRKN